MKKNKKENKRLNNIATFIIVIMIMFMSIVSIELIMVIYSEKININLIQHTLNTTQITKDIPKYDTSSLIYTDINLSNYKTKINNKCENDCNFKISMNENEYFYIIKKGINDEYYLNIVKDGILLLENKNIGKSLRKAYFTNYMENILFYNVIDNNDSACDYAVITNNNSVIDEFVSLKSNEMKFTNDGIIYYYIVCAKEGNTNAKRIKAIRLPYNNPKELSSIVANYNWCN